MSGANEWLLYGGGRIVFIARDDDPAVWDVDHFSRSDDSCARVATDMSREAAEAAADNWLRAENKFRLVLIEGGLS